MHDGSGALWTWTWPLCEETEAGIDLMTMPMSGLTLCICSQICPQLINAPSCLLSLRVKAQLMSRAPLNTFSEGLVSTVMLRPATAASAAWRRLLGAAVAVFRVSNRIVSLHA